MNSLKNLSASKTYVRCLKNMGIDGAERWHELRAESQTNDEADAKLGLEVMAATGHVIWGGTIWNWRIGHGVRYRVNGEMTDSEFHEGVAAYVIPLERRETQMREESPSAEMVRPISDPGFDAATALRSTLVMPWNRRSSST